ncbi:MAG: hypothetical protein Q4F83_15715 [Eubacteriales bacterium]|nr:hypothetical protein [Eubacteriales bacterium]
MQQILNTILLFYLAGAAGKDIKNKTVSVKAAVCFAVTAFVLQLVRRGMEGNGWQIIFAESLTGCAAGMLPGLILIGTAWITRQEVGYGDGIVQAVCGLFTGIEGGISILGNGLVASAIAAIFFLTVKRAGRKKEIPFVPCLLCGYIIWLCLCG